MRSPTGASGASSGGGFVQSSRLRPARRRSRWRDAARRPGRSVRMNRRERRPQVGVLAFKLGHAPGKRAALPTILFSAPLSVPASRSTLRSSRSRSGNRSTGTKVRLRFTDLRNGDGGRGAGKQGYASETRARRGETTRWSRWPSRRRSRRIGHASSARSARARTRSGGCGFDGRADAAVLDLRLRDGSCVELARALGRAGVRCLIYTGSVRLGGPAPGSRARSLRSRSRRRRDGLPRRLPSFSAPARWRPEKPMPALRDGRCPKDTPDEP